VYIPPYIPPAPPVSGDKTTTQVDDSGNVGKTTEKADGTVTAQVDMDKAAAQAAARNNDTVKLPVNQMSASKDAAKAPVVTVNTGIADEVKVEIPVKGVTAGTVVAVVGATVGTTAGAVVGTTVATVVGATVGIIVGASVATVVGATVGVPVGATGGFVVGTAIGLVVGTATGRVVGAAIGSVVGTASGSVVGTTTSSVVVAAVGSTVGVTDGSIEGRFVASVAFSVAVVSGCTVPLRTPFSTLNDLP
jgi:hypothetical protein